MWSVVATQSDARLLVADGSVDGRKKAFGLLEAPGETGGRRARRGAGVLVVGRADDAEYQFDILVDRVDCCRFQIAADRRAAAAALVRLPHVERKAQFFADFPERRERQPGGRRIPGSVECTGQPLSVLSSLTITGPFLPGDLVA